MSTAAPTARGRGSGAARGGGARAADTGSRGAEAATTALTREVPASRRPGWWGMVLFLVTDASSFASLIAAYYYLEFVTSHRWPPPGDPLPKLAKASIITGIIVVSCLPMAFADRAIRRGARGALTLGTFVTALCGIAFVVIEVFEYADELHTTWPQKDAYGSIFYLLTGYHVLHIMAGTLLLLLFTVAALAGRLTPGHSVVIRLFGLFWYTSVVIWVVIYVVLYWSVRL